MSVEDLEKAKKEVADLKEEIAGIQSWEDDMIPCELRPTTPGRVPRSPLAFVSMMCFCCQPRVRP
jgi:hypothetical protein